MLFCYHDLFGIYMHFYIYVYINLLFQIIDQLISGRAKIKLHNHHLQEHPQQSRQLLQPAPDILEKKVMLAILQKKTCPLPIPASSTHTTHRLAGIPDFAEIW